MAVSAYYCEKTFIAVIATCSYFYQLRLNVLVVSRSG